METESAKNAYSAFTGFNFRPGQREAIEYCYNSTKPVTILRAPVGSGKTLVGLTLGEMHDKFAYLCSSKQLQDQIKGDHGQDIALLMGRSNYPCNLSPNTMSAAQCINNPTDPCPEQGRCHYRRQKAKVADSRRQVLNYPYMLNEFNYIGAMKQGEEYPIMIADEADVLESQLTGFVSLVINKHSMSFWGLEAPPRKTFSEGGMSLWFRWAERSRDSLSTKLQHIKVQMDELGVGLGADGIELQREMQRLSTTISSLELFLLHADKTWIANETERAYEFKPLWLSEELAHKYYWSHAKKHVLMSGTWPPLEIIAKTLGLPRGDIDMIEIPSCFPVENSPIHLMNVADMGYKSIASSMPKMLEAIKKLLDKHSRHKGVIHTSNYALTRAIMDLGNQRLVTHTTSNRAEVIEAFKQSSKPLVFVSPSSTRGLDLPDDLCRFNILAKAPFASLADKFISARSYTKPLGQQWYTSLCAQEIEQAFGRGVRNESDWCENYSLDICANRLICGQPNMFSDHFLQCRKLG